MINKQYLLLVTVTLVTIVLLSPAVHAEPNIPVEGIPFKSQEVDISGMMIRAVFLIVILAGMAVGVLWLVKKYIPALVLDRSTSQEKRLKVIEVRRISPKTTLFLVEVDGCTILLGQGEGLSLLSSNLDCANAKLREDGDPAL